MLHVQIFLFSSATAAHQNKYISISSDNTLVGQHIVPAAHSTDSTIIPVAQTFLSKYLFASLSCDILESTSAVPDTDVNKFRRIM